MVHNVKLYGTVRILRTEPVERLRVRSIRMFRMFVLPVELGSEGEKFQDATRTAWDEMWVIVNGLEFSPAQRINLGAASKRASTGMVSTIRIKVSHELRMGARLPDLDVVS